MRGVLLLTLLALACANPPAPERAFVERPYVWAHEGRVELSSCRWLLDAPIGVALASGALPEEEHAFKRVLEALRAVLPGLRLLPVPAGAAQISVRFLDAPLTRSDGTLGSGRSVVDCRLGVPGARAAVVAAQVEIARRAPPDWRGRERSLTLEERSGALLHELAHALGAPGHAAGGDDLLASTAEAARRAGARALAGEPLASPALTALYARPSGELLQSGAVEAWRTFELDRLAKLAAAQPLDGPFLRAGDAAGRIFWRDARGREWGFLVVGLAELAQDPSQLLLVPEANTRNALPRRAPPTP
jgi:hypothetical protein